LVMSNHTGGQVDGAIGLLDIMPFFFDSSVRAGSDAFKALALSAKLVFVCRLYLWGHSIQCDVGLRHRLALALGQL
ncbi:hypothetical protein K437DRAFT_225432, partial [Tilletiaria anomala UBC 951]